MTKRRWTPRRAILVLLAVLAAAAVVATIGVVRATAPRRHVTPPARDASPEAVVATYADAVAARDFDTANALCSSDSTGCRYARLSRSDRFTLVRIDSTTFHTGGFGWGTRMNDWAFQAQVYVDVDLHAETYRGREPQVFDLVRNSESEPWRILEYGWG